MDNSELDVLIAEKVMGEPKPSLKEHPCGDDPSWIPWAVGSDLRRSKGDNWVPKTTGYGDGDKPIWVPLPFSSNVEYAWKVVEKIGLEINIVGPIIPKASEYGVYFEGAKNRLVVYDKPISRAICLAALKAIGFAYI